ncbi:PTS lactose/cellobiose transporter subunit IIA [Tepidibacillus sp. HK-1]|uniref:PTS lactose/cellobiose transporter subunit IIA n=1 Tax=Tepidibacillus sp. HK-1 TaxID=1883407 RepID=UPI0008589248|nr:PTS lactose/cellobiose transporter subunit IIA [Tepidibacillus sp. HK-1]GBF10738.1 lichenan-specific phosphotransferase enzyme IIA component [Tepidibacillus sp. HK-1]
MAEETTALDMEVIGFTIISNVGMAKSLVMEALYAAKNGDYKLAEEKIDESKKYFIEGHKVHSSLIQKEASGEKLHVSLILMHAEDQLMSAETISELVIEMIEMYKKINK